MAACPGSDTLHAMPCLPSSLQRLGALIALGAASLLASAPATACSKRLRWNDDPPYSMRLPDGRISGWSVDLDLLANLPLLR